MKILWKKSLIILLPIIMIIGSVVAYQFYLNTKEDISVNKKLTDEEIRQKYIEILSCIPEKPIDEKVLFAEAMKQYWQYRMEDLWTQDKTLNEVHNFGYKVNVVERHCGLKFDKKGNPLEITKETCYPWVTPYKDLEELFQALVRHKKTFNGNTDEYVKSAFRHRMYSINAKPYKPEIDENIYMGEQNFSIIKRDHATYTDFYPVGCCSLVAYKDIEQNIRDFAKKNILPYNLSRDILDNIYFLKVGSYVIDHVQEDRGYEGLGSNLGSTNEYKDRFFESKEKYGYSYYPISLCGKGVFSPYSLQ